MTPPKLLLVSTMAFLLTLAALVGYRLVTGKILTRKLLSDSASGRVSPLKIQMLIGTVTAAAVYATAIGQRGGSALPPVDEKLLALVGGSNVLVVGKQGLIQLITFLRGAR